MSDFNAKMHQIRFWLGRCPRPCGGIYNAHLTLYSWRGERLAAAPRRAHDVVKQRNTFLLSHTVPQKNEMHIRSFIGGVRATVNPCFFSDARPLAESS